MMDVVEFFRHLPEKKCHNCGKPIAEKAECYGNLCDDCESPAN